MERKVISLTEFRQQKKLLFRQKHHNRIQRFVKQFVEINFKIDFAMVNNFYLANKVQNNEMAWDYQDLRQELNDGISEVFGAQLWLEINRQYWFDRRLMDKDELLEIVVSFFVLGSSQVVYG